MKRCIIYFVMLALLGFYSCQNDAISDDPVEPKEKIKYELTNDEVVSLLSGYLNVVQKGSPATRGSSTVVTHVNKVRYDNPVLTRSGNVEDNGFTICTVDLKNGDKDGFAIVVADKRMPVVLAYSPNGKYADLKEKGGENLQTYVENIPNDVKAVLAQPRYLQGGFTSPDNQYAPYPYDNRYDDIYETSTIDSVWEDVALLRESVLWGQREPYNKFLPVNPNTGNPYPVGCVNVALSQIMAYYKYPEKYDWKLMTKLVNIENNPFATLAMEDSIATFIKELTVMSKTTFYPSTDDAGTRIENCMHALDTCNYTYNQPIYYNSNAVRKSLKAKKFVIAFGESYFGAGHAFVLSGYWKFTTPQSMKDKGLEDGTNLGVNWGNAGGWGDGWYLVEYGDKDITKLGLAKIDPYTGEYSTDYSYNMVLLTGISPKR